MFVKENGKITNREYQEINEASARTAVMDLDFLYGNIFTRKGERKGIYYEIANGVNGV